jgi:hypothetical protein
MHGTWVVQIRTGLKIARIFGGLAVHDPRVGRGNEEAIRILLFRGLENEIPHWIGVFLKGQGLLDLVLGVFNGEAFEVTDKVPGSGKVLFSLFVEPTVDSVIGTLKESVFAIVNEFGGFLKGSRSDFVKQTNRSDGGSRDVILCKNLVRGNEILSQGKKPPGTLFIETDSKEACDQLISIESQFVGRLAIYGIHAEEIFPVLPPLGPIPAFYDKDQILHPLRNGFEPIIEILCIKGLGRGQKLDHGTKRTVWIQDGAVS